MQGDRQGSTESWRSRSRPARYPCTHAGVPFGRGLDFAPRDVLERDYVSPSAVISERCGAIAERVLATIAPAKTARVRAQCKRLSPGS